ncbi:MAG TPA: amidohydrolase family protein [Candidatus Limnocylindrales bacterium]
MTMPPPFADDTRPLAIRVGSLLDVEAGDALGPRTLLVRDARIDAVAMPGDGAPDEARVIDLSAFTVLPGLIDTHSHLVGEVQTAGVPGTTTSSAQDAYLSVRNARVTVEAGFTTVRDLGPFRAFVDCALRDTINTGELEGPRMQCSGAFITAPWGGGDVVGLAHDITLPADLRFGVVTTPAEVRDRVRRLLIGGADLIKCIGTGAVLTRGGVPGAPELSEDELRAAVEEAANYGAFVAVHAHSDEGARRAIRAGARSVEHGSMLDAETIAMLADAGTFFSVDLFDGEWALEHGEAERWPAETMRKLAETMDTGIAAFGEAVRRGVRVTYGTDSGVYPHELVAQGLHTFVRCGMTPLAAIRSATTVAAECLGWADRVGSLAPGRFADLVAVEGDPLADIRVLETPAVVIKGGRIAADRRAG